MAQANNDNMTVRLLSYVFVALLAFGGGFAVGNFNNDGSGDADSDSSAEAVAANGDQGAETALPLGNSPVLGKKSAPITIVEFSDFQCPFCAKGRKTIEQLHKKYPNDVKVVFKQYPLGMHPQAPLGARAAIAAKKQGKFWEMHDWLFDHQKKFRGHSDDFKEWTAKAAKDLGMKPKQFKKDFDSAETKKVIDDEKALGDKVNVRGTPHFFVNGERVKGAKPVSAFESIIKKQLKESKKMLKQAGVTRANLYAKMVAKNFDGGSANANKKARKKPAQKVEYVPVPDYAASFGNTEDPLVTIVEFSDFQCPFCDKVVPTVEKIKDNYGDQVRFAYLTMPLGMHPQAQPAAQAAMAAHKQGKFWDMHDKLFANQKQFRSHSDDFKAYATGLAKELGMNAAKFEKDYDSAEVKKQIKQAKALAQQVGARGTPNFWVNGLNVRGAQPYSKFKSMIDAQIKVAKKIKAKKKVTGDALYKAVAAANKANAPKAKAKPRQKPNKPAPTVDPDELSLGDAPVRGPKDAPVTIVEFADFQCPYCKRGGDNLEKALEGYEGKVKLAYKHYPLPFHQNAKPAGRAALAAAEQGKFWEMHDLLYANQKKLGQDGIYVKYAKQLGLNMAQFKEDMKKPQYAKVFKQDMQQGQQVGVRGTPAFFINGTRLVGAQPTAKFKSVIDSALKKAN